MFSTHTPPRAAFLRLAVLLAALAAPLPSLAAAPELLLAAPASGNPAATVRFNARAALALARGEEALLTLPRLGTLAVVHDRREQHPDGDVTWAGYFKEWGGDYRVVLTASADGTLAGRVASPDGEFSLVPAPGGARLVDRQAAGGAPAPVDEDDAVPAPAAPAAPVAMAPRAPAMAMAAMAAAATANTTIDLMVVYTPALAKRYGKGLQTRINHFVAVANQAYADSGVKITLRLVHTAQVDYKESLKTSRPLNDLTYGKGKLAGISALRKRYGADLVQMIMSPSAKNVCGGGQGWINSQMSPSSADYGYSVFSDTYPGYCYPDDVVMAHELGHNMGVQHDRAHAAGRPGTVDFSGYSFGYGMPGKFADVMSAGYIAAPIVAKFSNPNIKCGPDRVPCGIAPGKPGAAYSAKTLNDNRKAVAAFMPAADAPQVTLTATPASVAYGGAATLAWSATRATACTASRGWSGRKALKGKASFKLKASATFTLTCAGPKGTASATATVKVAPPAVRVSAAAGPIACVFNWFERKYPKLYPASDPKKHLWGNSGLYAGRYYPATGWSLGFSATTGANDLIHGHVDNSGPNDDAPRDLGTLAKWMSASGCK